MGHFWHIPAWFQLSIHGTSLIRGTLLRAILLKRFVHFDLCTFIFSMTEAILMHLISDIYTLLEKLEK